MNIIEKIKLGIKKRIRFHKRLMFICSLYGCMINKNKNDFVDHTINKILKYTPIKSREIKAIKKEINYRIAKEIPFNPCILMDTDNYKTKVSNDIHNSIKQYFTEHPIPDNIANDIEKEYIATVSIKPNVVQRELVSLVHDLNINVGIGAVRLPLVLQHVWWDCGEFKKIFDDSEDVDRVVNGILVISPMALWYGSKENMESDIKNIILYIKNKL